MRKPATESFIWLEFVASILALFGIGHVVLNGIATYWCFTSTCRPPTSASIWTYRALAALTIVAVIGTLALARRRRARWTWIWHLAVGLVAVAAVAVFAVPRFDVREVLQPDRSGEPIHPQCLSPGPECDKLGG